MLTLDQRAEIAELLEDGLTYREVARRTGAGLATIHRFAREIDDESTAYLPSPEEIADKCAEIRSRWSDEEWAERSMFQVAAVDMGEVYAAQQDIWATNKAASPFQN